MPIADPAEVHVDDFSKRPKARQLMDEISRRLPMPMMRFQCPTATRAQASSRPEKRRSKERSDL